MNKKALMWPVIISVFLHLTVLAVTGAIHLQNDIKFEEVLSVTIEKTPPKEMTALPKAKKQTPKVQEKSNKKPPMEKGMSVDGDDWREETIDLGSADIKYVTYLSKIKRKILQIWNYPPGAYDRNEEGVVVVKMAVDADGRLSGVTLLTSSGFAELDNGALGVVQEAAPFDPLPEFYDLSRLNIIASFRYRITD